MMKKPAKTAENTNGSSVSRDELGKFCTRVGAARIAGVTEGAIRAAIERGELDLATTRCGLAQLLLVADVVTWAGVERKRGPKVTSRGA